MRYIEVPNVNMAERISEGLWRITKPDVAPSDTTQYYLSWFIHPVDGRVALAFPDDIRDNLHINSRADAVALLQLMPAAARAGIRDRFQNAKAEGRKIKPFQDLLPQAWKNRVFTLEQAIADGWFGEDDI